MTYYSLACLALLLTALLLWQKSRHGLIGRSLFFITCFCALFLLTGFQVANYFTDNGIDDSVVFHLRYGLAGAGFREYTGVIVSAIGGLLLALLLLGWHVFRQRPQARLGSFWALSLVLASFLFNPASVDAFRLLSGRLAFQQHFAGQADDDDFPHYYQRPPISQVSGAPRNLVVIYAESLERSYLDERVFPGLMPHLQQLEQQAIHFTDIRQLAATSWTIAGMTASQCGLPLFTPSHGNAMSGMDAFLPAATCLGDLLAGAGYYLSYIGGGDPAFAGKDKFYRSHGFDEVIGREQLQAQLDDPDYLNAWGLYDDSLLELVLQRFETLAARQQPFALFTLTLDTHHPSGHPTRSCESIRYQDGSNAMLNSVACADMLLSRFIKQLQASPFADNTVIALVSDHLAMNNDAWDLLQQTERRNLFVIIDPAQPGPARIDHTGSTLDIGSTVLPLLGFEATIGLGRNLLAEPLADDIAFIHANLSRWQQAIAALWDFPQLDDSGLVIDLADQRLLIGQRRFRFPVLVEIDEQQQTTLRFDFDKRWWTQKSLPEQRLEVPLDHGFILVDHCRKLSVFDRSLGAHGFCLISGKGPRNLYMTRLQQSMTLDLAAIDSMIAPARFAAKRIYHNVSGKPVLQAFEHARQLGFDYFLLPQDLHQPDQALCLKPSPAAGGDCSLAALANWLEQH
ncbi:MAG TPA: sulfatase-like hydrolase/transferase, partial [Pseudomonadales bacterium]